MYIQKWKRKRKEKKGIENRKEKKQGSLSSYLYVNSKKRKKGSITPESKKDLTHIKKKEFLSVLAHFIMVTL